jgi:hypothetical protein
VIRYSPANDVFRFLPEEATGGKMSICVISKSLRVTGMKLIPNTVILWGWMGSKPGSPYLLEAD